MFCKAKSAKKNLFLRGEFRPLSNKHFQMLDHFFPLLFPKDSESLKIFYIRLQEAGAKRPFNSTSKVNRQTNRQTHRQTDILTYKKHRPRGPMLWKTTNGHSQYRTIDHWCQIPVEISDVWVSLIVLLIGLTIRVTSVHLSAICAHKQQYVLCLKIKCFVGHPTRVYYKMRCFGF